MDMWGLIYNPDNDNGDKMKIIKQIAILTLILITLFASGCTDSGTQANANETATVNDSHDVPEINITPNLEILTVSIVGNNVVLQVRNNNDVAINNVYGGVIGIKSPFGSNLRINNHMDETISKVISGENVVIPCIYDEQNNLCFDPTSEYDSDETYVKSYSASHSGVARRYYSGNVEYSIAGKRYIGMINPHEVVEVEFALIGLSVYSDLIKIVYTEDKNYWATY